MHLPGRPGPANKPACPQDGARGAAARGAAAAAAPGRRARRCGEAAAGAAVARGRAAGASRRARRDRTNARTHRTHHAHIRQALHPGLARARVVALHTDVASCVVRFIERFSILFSFGSTRRRCVVFVVVLNPRVSVYYVHIARAIPPFSSTASPRARRSTFSSKSASRSERSRTALETRTRYKTSSARSPSTVPPRR